MKQLIHKGAETKRVLVMDTPEGVSTGIFHHDSVREPQALANTVSRGFLITTCLFVLLNASDFLLTAKLLSLGSFQEYNPVALFFIVQGGTLGMFLYKTLMVIIAIACCYTIFQQRKTLGLSVLWGGNILLASVVTYSILLLTNVITEETAPFYVYVGQQ